MTTFLLLFSSLTFAIVNDPDTTTDKNIVYRSVDEVDFEKGLEVDGEMIRPNGGVVNGRVGSVFNPLITLRVEFNEEMKNSANDIK
jgi:hypothetical protein